MTAIYELGPFRLDVGTRVLTRDGNPVALGPRAVAVLTALVERANENVPKDSIIAAAWPHMVVEEANLAVQISGCKRLHEGGIDSSGPLRQFRTFEREVPPGSHGARISLNR
jgi:DNA-binding winged helix-turn-helix (wHTH) protein